MTIQDAGAAVVMLLSDDDPVCALHEATVHRTLRSRIWQAVFTGPGGGQMWRSTGLVDRNQALVLAKKWEAEARAERANLSRQGGRTGFRLPRPEHGLTQREVAQLLGMSERGVRQAEKRALRKLGQNHLLRQFWQKYLAGELEESHLVLDWENEDWRSARHQSHPSDDEPSDVCDECGEIVPFVIGCPDGSEICQDCFDGSQH